MSFQPSADSDGQTERDDAVGRALADCCRSINARQYAEFGDHARRLLQFTTISDERSNSSPDKLTDEQLLSLWQCATKALDSESVARSAIAAIAAFIASAAADGTLTSNFVQQAEAFACQLYFSGFKIGKLFK